MRRSTSAVFCLYNFKVIIITDVTHYLYYFILYANNYTANTQLYMYIVFQLVIFYHINPTCRVTGAVNQC